MPENDALRRELRDLIDHVPRSGTPRERARWLLHVARLRWQNDVALELNDQIRAEFDTLSTTPPNAEAFPRERGHKTKTAPPTDLVDAIKPDDRSHVPILGPLVLILCDRLVDWHLSLQGSVPRVTRTLVTSSIYWSNGKRRLPKHGNGHAIDVGLSASDPTHESQVRELLRAAVKHGATEFGLPFQSVFFPPARKCGASPAPEDKKFLDYGSSSLFDERCTKIDGTLGQAASYLKDDDTRAILSGKKVYPDFDNHVHVAVT